jgi:hypothetical protein
MELGIEPAHLGLNPAHYRYAIPTPMSSAKQYYKLWVPRRVVLS